MTAAGGTISLLVGAVLLRLTVTGTYERYVRVGMWPLLIAAALVIILVGLVTLVQAIRQAPSVDAHDHHEHGEGIGAGWLLLAPIAALLLVAPPTLGSYGVDRAASVRVREGAPVFAPIRPTSGLVPMTLVEYGQRAFDHHGASFNDATVQLTGFVVDADAGGFRLARYQIACCAADAIPAVVQVVGTRGDTPGRDQWVTVTGAFRPGEDELPELTATSLVEIPAPRDPYE